MPSAFTEAMFSGWKSSRPNVGGRGPDPGTEAEEGVCQKKRNSVIQITVWNRANRVQFVKSWVRILAGSSDVFFALHMAHFPFL